MRTTSELSPYLKRFRLRLRLRDTWQLAQRSLWLACLISILILLIGRIWPLTNLRAWAAAPFGVWAVALLGFAIFQRLPALRVARRVDSELHLKERLSTSLLIDGAADPAGPARPFFQPELVAQQHAASDVRGVVVARAQALERGVLVAESCQEGERKLGGIKGRQGQVGYGLFDLYGIHSLRSPSMVTPCSTIR